MGLWEALKEGVAYKFLAGLYGFDDLMAFSILRPRMPRAGAIKYNYTILLILDML